MTHAVFLTLHIAGGTSGLVLGPVAMRAVKRRGTHTRAGEAYHWAVLVACASAVGLAALDFSDLWWLGLIGVFSYAFAFLGYVAAKRRWTGWLLPHVSGQGGSYIALTTALLVVNLGGPLIIWFLPTIVGSPVIAWVNFQVARGARPKGVGPPPGSVPAVQAKVASTGFG